MDWCFKEFRVPSFTFEILLPEYHSQNYDPFNPRSKHDNLVHWKGYKSPIIINNLMIFF